MNCKLQLYILFVLCCSTLGMQLMAQNGIITGKITSKETAEELISAHIILFDLNGGQKAHGVTDFEGIYNLKDIKPGKYSIKASYIEHLDFLQQIEVKAGETLTLDIALSEKTLDIVVVTDSRVEKNIESASISIVSVDPNLHERISASKADEVVEKVPGVAVVDGQANIRGGSGYSYGAGSRVLLVVDDMPFLSADAGFPNWRDLPIENLSGIEVLKGAGSALYGSSALNGIIHLRTAYATSQPETKIAIYGTMFGTPKRESLAWWKKEWSETDKLEYHDSEGALTEKAQFMSGRKGYRSPFDYGIQFSHKRQFAQKLFWTLGANFFSSDSYRAGEYERKGRVNSNLEYRLSQKSKIGVNMNFNFGRGGNFFLWDNTALFGSVVDTAGYIAMSGTVTETEIFRFNIDPSFTTYDKFNGRHRIQTRYYHIDNKNGNNQSNSSKMVYGEYQYSQKFERESGFLNGFNVVAGLVGQAAFSNAELYGNAKYTTSNVAAYGQFEKGFFNYTDSKGSESKRLLLTAGVRLENNTIKSPDSVLVSPSLAKVHNPNSNESEFKPVFRFGANYRVAEYTNIRASWGQGYRYPTIAERYISTLVGSNGAGLEIRANPNLKSETGWSAEIGIMQGVEFGAKDSRKKWKGYVDLAAFWSQYNDMMEFTFKGGDTIPSGRPVFQDIYFQSTNVGNTLIRGAEISFIGQGFIANIPVNIMTGYTFIDPRFKDFSRLQQLLSSDPEHNILKYRNRHTFKFDVEGSFLKNNALSVGLSVNYTSDMQAIDAAFENLNSFGSTNTTPIDFFGIGYYRANYNKGAHTDLSARVGYRFSFKKEIDGQVNAGGEKIYKESFGLKVSVVGKNLLNQEYQIRPALIAAPMNFTVRLDFDF